MNLDLKNKVKNNQLALPTRRSSWLYQQEQSVGFANKNNQLALLSVASSQQYEFQQLVGFIPASLVSSPNSSPEGRGLL